MLSEIIAKYKVKTILKRKNLINIRLILTPGLVKNTFKLGNIS